MFTKIISLSALIIMIHSSSALARGKMLDCVEVDDQMSWRVTVRLKPAMASFWDNDHETALKYLTTNHYESYPTQTVSTFEVKDGRTVIRFYYTKETRQGILVANVGSSKEFEVRFTCKLVTDDFDWSETEADIKKMKNQRR